MRANMREDQSMLAPLYDEHCQTYPTTVASMRRMIEQAYKDLYGSLPENIEQVTAVLTAIFEDENRFAFEEGIRTGVQLALDLELVNLSRGGRVDVYDC